MSAVKKTRSTKPLATTAAKPAAKDTKKPASKGSHKETIKEPKKNTKVDNKKGHQEIYIQYAGKQLGYGEVVRQVKDEWQTAGNKINQIKNLEIYIKPEDKMIYYVINGEVNGSIPM